MRRLSSPVFLYPLLALLILGGGSALYFIPWLTSREASLNDTALLSLAATGDQLSKRLSSMTRVLDALVRRKQGDPQAYLRSQAPWLEYEKTDTCEYSAKNKPLQFTVAERGSGGTFQISNDKHCVSADVRQVLGELLPRQRIFEEILLASEHGRIIYQTGLTALRVTDVSALLERHAGDSIVKQPTSSGPSGGAPSVQEVHLGDTDYELYLMPVPLSGLVNRDNSPPTLTLAGLIRKADLRSLALGQSGTVFIPVTLGALLVMFATWPILKFTRMGSTERIRRWTALALLASMLASTGLATLLILHFSYLSDPQERQFTDMQLQTLANSIANNTAKELKSVLESLAVAERSPEFHSAKITPPSAPNLNLDPTEAPSVLYSHKAFFNAYPYFDDIFWADAFGNQQIKWSAHAVVTPQTNLRSYSFFAEAIHGNLWSFPCPRDGVCPLRRFRVDPVYSPNSGEYVAIVSTRLDPEAPPEGIVTASITTRLASVIDPILPPDYGFAIIDQNGTILFHSTSGANIGRNIYSDCTNAGEMQAAADSRSPQALNSDYQGESNRFYVTPFTSISGCPWTLMVFRRAAAMAAKHVERMLLFFALILLYGGAASTIGIVVLFRMPKYPARWCWPEGNRNAEYLQLAAALFLIYWAALRLDFASDWRVAIAVSFVCGLGGFGVTSLHLRRLNRHLAIIAVLLAGLAAWFSSWAWAAIACACAGLVSRRIVGALKRFSPYESSPIFSYAFAMVALIFVSGVLPCIGFFKVADDFSHIKFLMRDQLETLRELEMRAHNLRERYASLLAREGETKGATWDLTRALILRARLNLPWDRLDGMSDSHWKSGGPQEWEEQAWPTIQKLAAYTAFVPNRGAELARRAGLATCRPDTVPETVCWSFEARGRLRLTRPQALGFDQLAELSSEETADLPESLVVTYSRLSTLNRYAIPGLIILGVALFIWVRSSLRRLFLLDIATPDPWPVMDLKKILELARNVVAIGLPGIGKSQAIREQNALNVIDMVEYLRGDGSGWNSLGSIVVLDQFDAALSVEDERGLDLLETLVRRGQQVVIVANSDPQSRIKQWFREADADEKRLSMSSRWEAALASFRSVVFDPHVRDSDPPFEVLWASATTAERVVLFQLARDGWVNNKSKDALIQLYQRGLIVRDPAFRIRNDSLRRQILQQIPVEQARVWSHEEGPSAWDGLRIVFAIVGFAILALLFFWAQAQGLALLTAGLSAVGSAAKVVADFRARKAAAPKVMAV